ncbi:hypothetical protein J3R30DRAFT_46925 [Lentinula aciculospora]|uniref:F-box domain-containing protein n=1 Tax=Lentinula aciculospora TaxID=153920 RepID=A0A9W9ATH5_9AGAR|nr:hypothetical protein J3R30DRAFT_46925 [Lentinula aciculospora]
MSIPAITAHIVDPLSASHIGSSLDTTAKDIAIGLTQIESILSDATHETAPKIQYSDREDGVSPVRVPRASFRDLPSEILLTIFSYSCQVGESWEALSFSLVCTQWRALMLADPSLWTHIALTIRDLFPNPTPSSSVSDLLRMARLTLLYLERSEDYMLSVTIKMPTRFRGLNANWQSYISVGAVDSLRRNSSRIEQLNLRVDHGLLHAFVYEDPCLAELDSGHNQPCSHMIPLPYLVSLSVEYISRHWFYFPFQHLPRLKHLALSEEGFSFFQKSTSETAHALSFPRLSTLVVSEPSSFRQLCRTISLIDDLPHIEQVVLTQIPRLADLSILRQQDLSLEISLLKISNSSDVFLSTFCRVFQFSGLKAFELVYDFVEPRSSNSPAAIAWSDLVCDIIYFIRRCPMIQSVTVRNAREHCYPTAELVQEITFEPQISPDVYIVGFPLLETESETALTATAMMDFLRNSEVLG